MRSGTGIVVADDRVDQLVNEGIGIELELLDREVTISDRNGAPGMSCVLGEPGVEPRSDARCACGMPPMPGGCVHHPLALGDRELAEQEEALARRRSRSSSGLPRPALRKADCVVLRGLLGEARSARP